jgi:hypothetical protein
MKTIEEIHELAFELLNESVELHGDDPEVITLRVDRRDWDNLWREYFDRKD